MARPRHDPDALATTERILQAAERAFARRGHAGTTLAEIARTAGIRRPSLLYHFGTKDLLYAAVVERSFAALGAVLFESIAQPGTFPERLRAVTGAYVRHLEEQPWLARLILREMLDDAGPGHELLLTVVSPLIDQVVAFIELEGSDWLRPQVPIRATLLDVASAALVRVASGGLGARLWPPEVDSAEVAALLFLRANTP